MRDDLVLRLVEPAPQCRAVGQEQLVDPAVMRRLDDLLRLGGRLAVAGAEQALQPAESIGPDPLLARLDQPPRLLVQLLGRHRIGVFQDARREQLLPMRQLAEIALDLRGCGEDDRRRVAFDDRLDRPEDAAQQLDQLVLVQFLG